jgi:hypothetical protein
MRPSVKTAIGIGVVIVLIVIAILGWRTATRAPEPPAPSASSSTGPSEGQPSPPATPTEPTESAAPDGDAPEVVTGVDAVVRRIPDQQWRRILSTGTWRPECPVGRSDLRRIELNYRTFDGGVGRGQLVANKDSVDDLVEIFSALFEAGFPIERMEPVERYGGEVLRSLEANNTSAFNCRKPGQINAPVNDSPHANGRAVDINPVQNPWRDPRCDCWQPGREFAKVKDGPGVIRKGSLPVQLFEARGWVWQNIDVPDYMHFDTGYPSRARDVQRNSEGES